MECKRCLMTDDLTTIKDGVCDFCRMHDKLEKLTGFDKIIEKVRKQKGYQCLIGISGGFDSSYLLWFTVTQLKLKPLVLHFDNKWNDPIAEHNMSVLTQKLNVDSIRISKDEYYDELCGALLKAGVKDADIANDMYMADMMQTVAKQYKIKYIFNGHDFRYEGSTPLAWTYMDARYLKDVYWWAYGRELKTKHLQTFWKQLKNRVKHIRVFHYVFIPEEQRANTLQLFGLLPYEGKHGENIYTKWIGYDLLPNKWGIDKRLVYLSAQVRSGFMDKDEAREKLKERVDAQMDWDEFKLRTGVSMEEALMAEQHTYDDFDHYNFKRLKPLIWVLMKLKLTSYQFYKKYAS